jgi:hypothetical protein
MNDFSNEYRTNVSLSLEVVRYCFIFISNPELQGLSADVFNVVTSSLRLPVPLTTFDVPFK